MKWTEWLRALVTLGATAAEAVRERRRLGDTRPAREIWDEVRTARIAAEKYRENVERHRAQKKRLGLPERDEE
jgi:hypothetical protein